MPTVDMPIEELQTYRGSSPRPDDFDEYWEEALSELGAHREGSAGFNPEWVPAAFQVPFAECWDLYFDGVRGGRIHGRCVFPTGLSAGGAVGGTLDGTVGGATRGAPGGTVDRRGSEAVPAVFRFHGYTGNAGEWSRLLPYAASGIAIAAIDVRGQGGESTDPGGVIGNTQRGHIVRGVEAGPKDLLYRHIFLDTVAVVQIFADLPRIDATRLGTVGASQGGALSLVCAALEPRITHAWAVYPFLSDYRRVWELEAGNSAYEEIRSWLKRRDPRHERIEEFFLRLGYIDIQYLAERIRGEVVCVTGLMDEVCPPSSQFAAYNRLDAAASKRMILYPDFGHEDLPDMNDMALRWFIDSFGLDGTVT